MGLNLGCQAGYQAPLPAELSCQPKQYFQTILSQSWFTLSPACDVQKGLRGESACWASERT